MDTVPFNFGGLADEPLCAYDRARCVVLPVPYEGTVTYRTGAAGGPSALIDASRNMELFDDQLRCEPASIGIHTLPEPLLPSDPGEVVRLVEVEVAKLLADGKLPVVLGGEHSISIGAAAAAAKRFPALSVLQIDAHADLRDTYRGSRYSHACAGARISELAPLVQVAIRSLSAEEFPRAGSPPVTTFFARDWHDGRIPDLVAALSDEVYVTIDLDGLDPSIMPGTGTPEPGGLSWRDATALLARVAAARRVVGFDVVELAPIPGSVASEFTAARLVYRFLGCIARARGWLP